MEVRAAVECYTGREAANTQSWIITGRTKVIDVGRCSTIKKFLVTPVDATGKGHRAITPAFVDFTLQQQFSKILLHFADTELVCADVLNSCLTYIAVTHDVVGNAITDGVIKTYR